MQNCMSMILFWGSTKIILDNLEFQNWLIFLQLSYMQYVFSCCFPGLF